MENFISGYPANEEAQRQTIRQVLGQEKYEFFFDRFLEYFFTEADAAFIQSLGLNLLRLPLNYRHFEDDMLFNEKPRIISAAFFSCYSSSKSSGVKVSR